MSRYSWISNRVWLRLTLPTKHLLDCYQRMSIVRYCQRGSKSAAHTVTRTTAARVPRMTARKRIGMHIEDAALVDHGLIADGSSLKAVPLPITALPLAVLAVPVLPLGGH